MTKPNTNTPARMETIAAYIFQNENLLQEALIMHHKSNTQPHHKGHARLSNTGPFRNIYVTDDGFLIADNTSDLYINEGERCTYCNNWYETRTLNINCHLVTKLTENTSKLWIDLYNHIIPIVEAYHYAGAGIALPPATVPTQNTPKRRPSVAAYIVQSGEKIKAAMNWWMNQPNGTQLVSAKEYERVDRILDAAKKNLESAVLALPFLSNDQVSKFCAEDEAPEWIEVYNALLNIAEHYHAFTNEQNAAPMDTPTTEKESPNAEAVESSESKTTTTYICGRCDTEHTSMTSAAMCCPDVDIMHTCNKCGFRYDTRAAADYCCSSIKTEHPHPSDHTAMLYACRTCNTIPFGDPGRGAQQCAADQHCNPMIEK